jgi:hypothetical protein
LVKFQPQLRFRLSSLRQLRFQLLGSGGLGPQTLEFLCMLLLEQFNLVGRHRVYWLGLK